MGARNLVAGGVKSSARTQESLRRLLSFGCEMAHSVEGRPPFLDHILWELLVDCPVSLVTSGLGKALLRDAFRGKITPEIASQPKHPFMAPPLGGSLLEDLRDRLHSDEHLFIERGPALARLDQVAELDGPDAWEWEPALTWLLSSYEMQRAWM